MVRFILPVIAILFLFASCSSERNFSKRKYLPGFFKDHTGKKEITAAENKEPANAFNSDSSAAEPVFKAEQTKTIAAANKISDSIPVPQKFVSKNETRESETEPQLIPAKENPAADEPAPGFDEQKRTNLALIFALIAIALFLTAVITIMMGITGLLTFVCLLAALGLSITGMVLVRKVRQMHLKGEDYEGKTKVIFARIIGITGIVLTAAFLAILAFAIAVFAYGYR